MITGLVIWILGLLVTKVTSLYCFGVMNCVQYANRARQSFPVIENSAGSCCLKIWHMAGVALIF